MLLGEMDFRGKTLTIYVHIVARDSFEIPRFRRFRERLLADAELRDRYSEFKRSLIA